MGWLRCERMDALFPLASALSPGERERISTPLRIEHEGRARLDPIMNARDALLRGARSAAIKGSMGFNAVTNNFAAAMVTLRSNSVNRALKRIEHVRNSIHDYFKRFVIFISTNFALRHNVLLLVIWLLTPAQALPRPFNHLFVFGLGYAFFDQLFRIGLFIMRWNRGCLVTRRTRHGIPTFAGRQLLLSRLDVILAHQLLFGLGEVQGRKMLRRAPVDHRNLAGPR